MNNSQSELHMVQNKYICHELVPGTHVSIFKSCMDIAPGSCYSTRQSVSRFASFKSASSINTYDEERRHEDYILTIYILVEETTTDEKT